MNSVLSHEKTHQTWLHTMVSIVDITNFWNYLFSLPNHLFQSRLLHRCRCLCNLVYDYFIQISAKAHYKYCNRTS